jgi:pimeloyl-ACP methyl ester carboxylesterase
MLRSWYIAFFQIPRLPEALLGAGDGGMLARCLRDSSRKGVFDEAQLAAYRAQWRKPGALRAMLDWYRAARYPITAMGGGAHAPKILPPTLLLWGRRDHAVSASLARPSIERCAAGRLVFLDAATHWLQHEEPARVNELLLEHLAGPPPAA